MRKAKSALPEAIDLVHARQESAIESPLSSSSERLRLGRANKPIYDETVGKAYDNFDRLNGQHPWQEAIPGSYLLYPVRQLSGCQVAYFNFALAREMGLITLAHPNTLNRQLEKKILDTFALQIINEYDQLHRRHRREPSKKHAYMATRYLQLQHTDKAGRTSGDGRSIWNGCVSSRGKSWDVSSRGTGVTALAPGAVEAKRPLKTGSFDFGYGCGMADIDELLSSAIMSEIFHHSGVHTERMLAIIDVGKGLAIGVRAADNLMRPAHLFLHLKQGQLETLKQATDYLIERQRINKKWFIDQNSKQKYWQMCRILAQHWARFAAHLEREYIFMWLDWDGDNCLVEPGIIDYGSIRLFGLRHDQYRYQDVDRYSTNLNGQKSKARAMVQTFLQIAHALQTGSKCPYRYFNKHYLLSEFDTQFVHHRREILLKQMGFTEKKIALLLKQHTKAVEHFEKNFGRFERAKSGRKIVRLPDGINRLARYNMRRWLREAPRALSLGAEEPSKALLRECFKWMLAEECRPSERKYNAKIEAKLRQLFAAYLHLVRLASADQPVRKTLLHMATRAQSTCRDKRLTGNGVEHVVGELLRARRKKKSWSDIQLIIDEFISVQVGLSGANDSLVPRSETHKEFVEELVALAEASAEDV